MDANERIKMVKAMEFVARQINDEDIFIGTWLSIGVADGEIEYGDLAVGKDDPEDLSYYLKDVAFADLMDTFLRVMSKAYRSGGLYCDRIVSKPE